ncbi:primosomal protein N' [Histophilus somni]|uniref:Replication restart protein PriA n=1 Tax=Histophilus somni TaxID=731 RepID=A0A9Q6YYI8_HISSO|nr:primosomal protein N' [Histophilus somni]ARU65132.1 primosomal protein N' [Histophilus somni]ARU66997.1 primosomal protein N' [Histophilus somni]ARU68868.1 primosomal protein N' [Histophilus somni]ARU70750.1 primosomal protein N' [Histophilus somni]ARU72623.1 primosomal protein N' [Histophilus somni]
MKLARVALAVPLFSFFDYLIPNALSTAVGCRVLVPFGRQKLIGIVTELPEKTEIDISQLKPIISVLDHHSVFTPELWHLLHWGADYYQFPLGEVLISSLPSKLRRGESAVEKSTFFFQLTEQGQQALDNNKLKRAKKQLEALHYLQNNITEKNNNPFHNQVWSTLKSKGYISEQEIHKTSISWQQKLNHQSIVKTNDRLPLNQEQALALSQLTFQSGFICWLLEGVTGSGKTEIYLQFIEEILQQEKQILVLVSEIGLTPQTVQRFQARFNIEIDVLHSNLNDNQRLKVWQRSKNGESAVIIGTRSALFTPFKQLGLIIVDEEHDLSFKQQDNWRYHARDLAVVYAKQLDIPIVLGSATPSLESINNVRQGKYRHITLKKRARNTTALRHSVIDLKRQIVHNGLSETLLTMMKNHLKKGNQVLLFLNRRGFAPVLLCHECGWIVECQHCEKPYTYHQHQRVLRCHHCGTQKPIPMQCVNCGSTHLVTTGLGTEQLEGSLNQRFPNYKITRIDRDSTARKGKLEQYLRDIQLGKSQILIGTQMLAKGHHFPNVTLVALLNVDSALFSTDFRAEERLAQLYVQVAGRAGREEKQGEVVLQTHYPEHPLLVSLLSQGYPYFAQQALTLRNQMGLPPFSAQALFKAQSRHSQKAEEVLHQIAAYFHNTSSKNLQILGPIQAPFSKKAGQYRWHLLLQHKSKAELQQILHSFQQENFLRLQQVRLVLDIDPLDLS